MKKYKDLGLQTLASIARAAHPMRRYREIVEGFPKVTAAAAEQLQGRVVDPIYSGPSPVSLIQTPY